MSGWPFFMISMDGHKTGKTGQSGPSKNGSVLSKNGQKNGPVERKKPLFWWGGSKIWTIFPFSETVFFHGGGPKTRKSSKIMVWGVPKII